MVSEDKLWTWLTLLVVLLFVFATFYIVIWFGAYKQAFFWKHSHRKIDDATNELLAASGPFLLIIAAALAAVWGLPTLLHIESQVRDLAFYQAAASVAIWFVAQMYWWGWVVERIRKPPE